MPETMREIQNEEMKTLLEAFPASFTSLSPVEQQISIGIYRRLAEGQPVMPTRLGAEIGVSEETMDNVLDQWPGVYRDNSDRIIGYWGLALEEQKHRFGVDERTLYTWCAWDSLFIPALIDKTAQVRSECGLTGAPISLTVAPDGLLDIEPAGTVMSFVEPQEEAFSEDVIGHFCHYVHFFASKDAGLQWANEHSKTFILSLQDSYELGRRKNRTQYPGLAF